MDKIIILGNSGSGKSTLAGNLNKKLNIDLLYLDVIVYRHNWNDEEKEQINEEIRSFMQKDKWIIDGNFLKKVNERFENCDTIFFLDINRFTCLFSVIKRYFKYKGKHRDSRSDLNDEKLSFAYLKWVFSGFYKTSRKKIKNIIANSKAKVIIFKNRKQINKYLKEL